MKSALKSGHYRTFFRALSNATRLSVANAIKKKPMSVTDICGELGFKQSRVSRSLRFLSDCGFVQSKREGKQKLYVLNQETVMPIMALIDLHMEKYCRHMEKCGKNRK